jgi:7-keto-8-aminopelargonate synthetase-like enzyme
MLEQNFRRKNIKIKTLSTAFSRSDAYGVCMTAVLLCSRQTIPPYIKKLFKELQRSELACVNS